MMVLEVSASRRGSWRKIGQALDLIEREIRLVSLIGAALSLHCMLRQIV
jgi:hypothetical protein